MFVVVTWSSPMATAVPSEMSSCMKETTTAEIDPAVIQLHVVATAAAKELGNIESVLSVGASLSERDQRWG